MGGVMSTFKRWLFAEDATEPAEELDPEPAASSGRRKSPILLHSSRQGEIYVRKPKSQEDALFPADCLKARRPIVVNLQQLDATTTQRVFDFLKGVVYGVDGHMEKVAEGIYVLTPRDLMIQAEELARTGDKQEALWQDYS
jgi:cell division inhibitor SepF